MNSSEGLFQKLSGTATNRPYIDGETIYLQGDAADALFRIERGSVKLAVSSKGSKKMAVTILRAGDCFGEDCIVENSLRRCTASSIRESTIGRIPRGAMIKRLAREPAFAKLFVTYLLLRIGSIEDNLVDQVVNSSERRLARLLLQLCDGKQSERTHADMHVDQGTLAQVVGTTRSRVSHFMTRFRKQGFISYDGNLRVHKALLTFFLTSPAAK